MKNIYTNNKKIIFYNVTIIASVIIIGALIYKTDVRNTNIGIDVSTTTPEVLTFKENEISNMGQLKYQGGYIADINGRYTGDSLKNVFSEIYLTKNIDGKDIILYKIKEDGFYGMSGRDLTFNPSEYGGFRGCGILFVGNDFFVVQYIGLNKTKFSDPIVVYWDSAINEFNTTLKVPETVMEILNNGNLK